MPNITSGFLPAEPDLRREAFRDQAAGMTEGLRLSVEGWAGRIRLDRPEALNALTHDMVLAMAAALLDWAKKDRVRLVMIEGAGDRAFCAGGDIQKLYRDGRDGRFSSGQSFWRDEYRLNRLIRHFPKPFIALMDGIVMGGGAGVAVHGSHRVVTQRTIVAMPECAIGLVPDVGVSLLLAHAGRLGAYLALTGARMGPGDAIRADFGDVFVPRERLPALIERLVREGDTDAIAALSQDPPISTLEPLSRKIDQIFAGTDALAIVQALEADGSEFGAASAKAMRGASPLSLAATLRILEVVRATSTIEAALAAEFRFTFRAQQQGDFLEGIRAAVIEKDRAPRWSPARLEDLSPAAVTAMLAPLGDDELIFAEDVP